MARVACLHHLEQRFTGHAGAALRAAGIDLDERDLLGGDPLPALDEVDGIVSFGGDQSVRDIASIPYLQAEAELLREAVANDVPVFGVCLGGQLLAHALGGEVRRQSRRQVSWEAVEPLPAAAHDPSFGDLPAGAMALHWNEDCFEPPPGGVELLARRGEGCEAFRAGARAWGVQFHPEVRAEDVDGWYRLDADWLVQAGVSEEEMRAQDRRFLPGQARLAEALFGGFARVVQEARAGV